MRLAGQKKLGFYPANPAAIAGILTHLTRRPLDPNRVKATINIIDPCCGQAEALKQLQAGLEVPGATTYAVELDPKRVAAARENNPEIPVDNILGPASFLNVQITGTSFGMAYVNPPFDDEIGGGRREEEAFCRCATRLLVPKGIMVLVCPFRALSGNTSFVEFIDSRYEDVAVYKFPDGEDEAGNLIRPFNEIVVFGKKRLVELPLGSLDELGVLHKMGMKWGGYSEDINKLTPLGGLQPVRWSNRQPGYDREEAIRVWDIPLAWAPNVFKKTTFTDDELAVAIAESPLNKQLEESPTLTRQSPPLPLDKGHLGLILASGVLDGVVEGPHGCHVVRGSSQKVRYHNKAADVSRENPETGAVTTIQKHPERLVTIIRVVSEDGEIRTFSNEPVEEEEEDDDDA